MRRKAAWIVLGVILTAWAVLLAWPSPDPFLSRLLTVQRLRPLEEGRGASDDPRGGSHPQWIRTYLSSGPPERLVRRIEGDLAKFGLSEVPSRQGREWATPSRTYRILVSSTNPDFWRPSLPHMTYVQIREPRLRTMAERIDDAYLDVCRLAGIRHPTFYPVPVPVHVRR